jgi:alpha-beta hydrolase superfamily lysophospholipase
VQSVATPTAHDDIGTELVRDWVPADDVRASIVLVHGLAEHSGRYERTGSLLSDAGFHVRSFDLIGAGASGGDRWDIDEWSRYHDQIETHIVWARDRGHPVVLMGHSLGGNLALGYAISDRPSPDLLVVSAPALSGGAAWQKAIAPAIARVLPTVLMPNGVKGEHLSRDPAVGEAYFSDPLVHIKSTTRLGAAFFTAMDDVVNGCDNLDMPTLVLHGGKDPSVPPQSTAFLGDISGVERRLYPELRHEILNEPEGPEIVAEIIDWVNERI